METKTGGMAMDEVKDKVQEGSDKKTELERLEVEYVFCCKIDTDQYEYLSSYAERQIKMELKHIEKMVSGMVRTIFNSHYKRGFIVKKKEKAPNESSRLSVKELNERKF